MDTKIQDLRNSVRTVRYDYKAFQNKNDITHKFKFRHLGSISTIYKDAEEERTDLQKEYYVNNNLFVEVLDKNILQNKFQLSVSNICAHMPYFDIIDMNGIVTIKSLVSGHHTVFLSDVMEKFEKTKENRHVLLTMDFTKYRLVKEIYMQMTIHARRNAIIKKDTRVGCTCDGTGGFNADACCTHCN